MEPGSPFVPVALFDLGSFAHAALFDGVEYVWEVLARIGTYVKERVEPGIAGEVEPGAHLFGDVQIGAGTRVEAGAVIRGPAIIGARCLIRSHAFLRDGNVIGDGCTVGNASELKNALLLDGAHAPHFNYVGDSVLGARTNLGAGTKLSNLRLDRGEIVLRHGGRSYPTGLRKFGAILGDGAQTGCNSVLNPGTVLGRGALVHPCAVVGGYVPPGGVVSLPPAVRSVPEQGRD